MKDFHNKEYDFLFRMKAINTRIFDYENNLSGLAKYIHAYIKTREGYQKWSIETISKLTTDKEKDIIKAFNELIKSKYLYIITKIDDIKLDSNICVIFDSPTNEEDAIKEAHKLYSERESYD